MTFNVRILLRERNLDSQILCLEDRRFPRRPFN